MRKALHVDDLSSDLASLKIDRTPQRARNPWMARTLGWLGVLVLIAVALAWSFPRIQAHFFKTAVKTATIVEVSPSLAVTALTATGYVIAERRSKVGTSVTGRITALHVREGSQVKQGQVLVEFDAADQKSNVAAGQARVLAAEAKVASARARLSESKLQLERQRTLLAQGVATRSVVEDLEARLSTAQAEIQSAQAEVHTASVEVQRSRISLDRMTVLAPIDGTVLDKPLDVGESVEPAQPLMEIADLNSLVIEIDVPETRLSLIKLEGPTEITLDAFAGKRLRGRVRELGRRINRAKATVPVKVAFIDDNAGVLPEMSARVSFLTEAIDPTAAEPTKHIVPARAVVSRDGKRGVFVAERESVHFAEIKLGTASGDGFELLSGPSPGTRVVIDPDSALHNGQRIKERTE